jgi:hypothetical protein
MQGTIMKTISSQTTASKEKDFESVSKKGNNAEERIGR